MKYLKIAVLLLGLSGFAQSKVGAVDVDYILSNMPELSTVQGQLETYGRQLDASLTKKIDSYRILADAYQTGEAKFSETEKRTRQDSLVSLETDIQKFQQNGAKLMQIKRSEYLAPLYQKIGEALEKVAKADGYTQVMQSTADVVYLDPKYDLTQSVIKKMGIVIKEEQPKK